MMVLDARARARSTHLGIGDDVLRNVGRALAQTHARTHGDRFEFGIECAIDRMRRDVSSRVGLMRALGWGMGWDALDSCVHAFVDVDGDDDGHRSNVWTRVRTRRRRRRSRTGTGTGGANARRGDVVGDVVIRIRIRARRVRDVPGVGPRV